MRSQSCPRHRRGRAPEPPTCATSSSPLAARDVPRAPCCSTTAPSTSCTLSTGVQPRCTCWARASLPGTHAFATCAITLSSHSELHAARARRMGLGEGAVLQKASTSFDQSIAVRGVRPVLCADCCASAARRHICTLCRPDTRPATRHGLRRRFSASSSAEAGWSSCRQAARKTRSTWRACARSTMWPPASSCLLCWRPCFACVPRAHSAAGG